MPKSAPSPRSQADATAEDLRELLREAELALSDAGVQATDKVAELRERLRDALEQGKDTVKNLAASARRQAAHADELIHENPYAAIGIAAGVGLIAGYLISRCNCTRR
jgi:ElaB/YqjD/DUF883 family membrane-anchored ribosome-binding protein